MALAKTADHETPASLSRESQLERLKFMTEAEPYRRGRTGRRRAKREREGMPAANWKRKQKRHANKRKRGHLREPRITGGTSIERGGEK